MKPKDITEHDHPLAWYTWKKDEVEFINARVKLAYEEGQKQTVNRAVEEIMELTKRIAELEAAKPEQSEPVAELEFYVDEDGPCLSFSPRHYGHLSNGKHLLYTAPPLRELSKPEIDTIAQQAGITAYEAPEWLQDFATSILAAARSKT